MAQNPKASKYSNVKIMFANADDAVTEYATIIDRGDEMVLEIADRDFTYYLVVGRLRGHYYLGTNSAPGDVAKVHATWTALNGKYIGFWIEDGEEYLFSFKLAAD